MTESRTSAASTSESAVAPERKTVRDSIEGLHAGGPEPVSERSDKDMPPEVFEPPVADVLIHKALSHVVRAP